MTTALLSHRYDPSLNHAAPLSRQNRQPWRSEAEPRWLLRPEKVGRPSTGWKYAANGAKNAGSSSNASTLQLLRQPQHLRRKQDSHDAGRSPTVRNMMASIPSSPRGRGHPPATPATITDAGAGFQVEVARVLRTERAARQSAFPARTPPAQISVSGRKPGQPGPGQHRTGPMLSRPGTGGGNGTTPATGDARARAGRSALPREAGTGGRRE